MRVTRGLTDRRAAVCSLSYLSFLVILRLECEGRYGAGLEDTPTLSWRVAAFFFGLATLITWIAVAASLLAPFFAKFIRICTSAVVLSGKSQKREGEMLPF